jgi:hypothetical protein
VRAVDTQLGTGLHGVDDPVQAGYAGDASLASQDRHVTEHAPRLADQAGRIACGPGDIRSSVSRDNDLGRTASLEVRRFSQYAGQPASGAG